MDLKQRLMSRALRLLEDPRVSKAMQNPTLLEGVMTALSVRAKLQKDVEERVQRVASRLNLVTGAELRELKRKIRRLERELQAQQLERNEAQGRDSRRDHPEDDRAAQ